MSARVRRASLDLVLGGLGVLFGLGSLTYPFGRDQGLYFYVAREWVLRGAIPYRDVLDHKTPGIYLLHALSILLFGETMWGIRLFDLVCVVGVGVVGASLSAGPGERVRGGVRGATILATSVLYYGYLDFWNTAQSELWYGMLGVASVAAAVRTKRPECAALVAGLLAGSALLMKPPAMWIVLVAVICLVRRTKRFVVPLLLFGVGGAIVPAGVLGYFAMKGALPAMLDIVVGANSYYVKHERGGTPFDMLRYLWCYFPLVPALLAYLAWAIWRARRSGDRAADERHTIAALITTGAWLAVIVQGKYYLLHWTVCVPAFAVIAANAARAIAERTSHQGRRWAFGPDVVVSLFALYIGAGATWHGPQSWWASTKHAWRWTRGQETRDDFTWHFAEPGVEFFFWTSERVGTWLRDHTKPDELVTVRGFQPEIYAVAKRRHGGRFFWTTFITNPARAYKRKEWLREDLDALKANPPKYVVALTHIKEGPDSVSYFERLGYRTVEVMWEFTIMERIAP